MFQSPGDIAFSIFSIHIHWYGVIIATAFFAGLSLTSFMAKKYNENPDKILDLAVFILIGAIIGARLYFVLFNWGYFSCNLQEIFMTWLGGLSIHGALVGGFLTGSIYARVNKLSILKYADICAYGLLLGQCIGRWGNFFNSEAFGTPTDLPWKLYIPIQNRPYQYINFEYFHPTFLYESILNFILLLFFYFMLRPKVEKKGIIFFSYLIGYSVIRILIEGIRTDNIYSVLGLPIAQFVSIVLILVGIIGIFLINRKEQC